VGVASDVTGCLGQQHIIICFFVCTRRAGAAAFQGREEVINHKKAPRWAARSASFRGDGWILWEIGRPCARSLVPSLLTGVKNEVECVGSGSGRSSEIEQAEYLPL